MNAFMKAYQQFERKVLASLKPVDPSASLYENHTRASGDAMFAGSVGSVTSGGRRIGNMTRGPWTVEMAPSIPGSYAVFEVYSGRNDQQHGLKLMRITELDWNGENNLRHILMLPDLMAALREIADPDTTGSEARKIAEHAIRRAEAQA